MPECNTDYLQYWGDEWVARWSEGLWALENIARCTLQYIKIYRVCAGLSKSASYRYRTERLFGVEWTPHEANSNINYEVSCGFSKLAWRESERARDRRRNLRNHTDRKSSLQRASSCAAVSLALFSKWCSGSIGLNNAGTELSAKLNVSHGPLGT